MNNAVEAVLTIATAIIGVAIFAIVVSRNSQTVGVIQAFGALFTSALGVAESPITGANTSINTSNAFAPSTQANALVGNIYHPSF